MYAVIITAHGSICYSYERERGVAGGGGGGAGGGGGRSAKQTSKKSGLRML